MDCSSHFKFGAKLYFCMKNISNQNTHLFAVMVASVSAKGAKATKC
jgi:hypothetical protein